MSYLRARGYEGPLTPEEYNNLARNRVRLRDAWAGARKIVAERKARLAAEREALRRKRDVS